MLAKHNQKQLNIYKLTN